MLSLNPSELKVQQLHSYLLGAIGPRPIAFASTIDEEGKPNLAPFSFFNVFSAAPPILIFSPARSGRTNTTKHTYNNVKKVPEVVINVVTYDMVHQTSLASSEYPEGVNEFVKSGFNMLKSDLVKPFRVKESPVQLECKVNQVIELGETAGAGNLIICEVVKIHINESVLNAAGVIDQTKIDLVARMGGNWYCRAHGDSLFEIEKPLTTQGIGFDSMPKSIVESRVLSGNDLGQLGNVEKLPAAEEINEFKKSELFMSYIKKYGEANVNENAHKLAKELIEKGCVVDAWKLLLTNEMSN